MSPSSERRIKLWVDRFIQDELVDETREENIRANDDRADRCWDAAEHGCEGSTHAEIIGDWRDAFRWERRCLDNGKPHDRFEAAVEARFDAIEAWHEKAGTLWKQVG